MFRHYFMASPPYGVVGRIMMQYMVLTNTVTVNYVNEKLDIYMIQIVKKIDTVLPIFCL